MTPREGQSIADGKYRLIRQLGQGGMGSVWLAEQRGAEGFVKKVVIKLMLASRRDKEQRRLFLNEARLAARLHHPNIVTIYDLGQTTGFDYIAMEWIPGVDLEELQYNHSLTQESPLPWPLITAIMLRVCEGLHYAHNQTDEQAIPLQIIHRDLKPANILLAREGYVKLIDFGIAKASTNVGQTRPGAILGTPTYMAPEQVADDPMDHRADLFSVGVILYKLCTGQAPFYGDNILAVFSQICNKTPSNPQSIQANLPEALGTIIMKALAKRPEERFQSAKELQRALKSVLASHQQDVDTDALRALYSSLKPANEKPKNAELESTATFPPEEFLPNKRPAIEESTFYSHVFALNEAPSGDIEEDESGTSPQIGHVVSSVAIADTGSESTETKPSRSASLLVVLALIGLGASGYAGISHLLDTTLEQAPTTSTRIATPASKQRVAPPPSPTQRVTRPTPDVTANKAANPPPQKRPKTPRKRALYQQPAPVRTIQKRAPQPLFGDAKITVNPTCILFRRGRELGIAKQLRIKLPIGRHTLRCVNVAKQFNHVFSIRIKAGKTTTRHTSLQRGTLWLLSFPVDAIFQGLASGGRRLGRLKGAPRTAVPLYQGKYRLTVQRRGGTERKTIPFVIRVGKRTIQKVIWR